MCKKCHIRHVPPEDAAASKANKEDWQDDPAPYDEHAAHPPTRSNNRDRPPAYDVPRMHRMTEPPPRYIVLRPAPDLGPGILDEDMNGQWYDREYIQVLGPDQTIVRLAGDVVFVAVATSRTETDPARPPGHQTAQVWEVRP